jgi:hypothetical protein
MGRSVECYGCDKRFKTFTHMLLHLESGGCDSGIGTLELNTTAANCHQWQQFIDKDYRNAMLSGRDLREGYQQPTPFLCPECENEFSKLSALFQHVLSISCAQKLNVGAIGRLVKWLKIRHG